MIWATPIGNQPDRVIPKEVWILTPILWRCRPNKRTKQRSKEVIFSKKKNIPTKATKITVQERWKREDDSVEHLRPSPQRERYPSEGSVYRFPCQQYRSSHRPKNSMETLRIANQPKGIIQSKTLFLTKAINRAILLETRALGVILLNKKQASSCLLAFFTLLNVRLSSITHRIRNKQQGGQKHTTGKE